MLAIKERKGEKNTPKTRRRGEKKSEEIGKFNNHLRLFAIMQAVENEGKKRR